MELYLFYFRNTVDVIKLQCSVDISIYISINQNYNSIGKDIASVDSNTRNTVWINICHIFIQIQ